MAKKINVKSVWFDVNADVVVSDDNGIEVVKFSGEGASTKSKRELSKTIRESYEDDGFEVIAIRNIVATRVEHIDAYIIDATNAQIVNACREFGLVVREVADTDADTADGDEDETE